MSDSQPSAPPDMNDLPRPPPYEEATGGMGYAKKEEFTPLTGGYPPQQPGSNLPPYPVGGPPQQQYYPGYPTAAGYQPVPPGYPPQGPGYPPQGPGYPPQGPGYPPQGGPAYPQSPSGAAGGATTVIIQQPTVVQIGQFREEPVQTVCPSCRSTIVTGITYETGTLTWLVCAICCFVGCDAGCCLIPFCMDGCKDAVHVCPNCHNIVGRYNRL